MSLITVSSLKEQLDLEGVDYEYTDEQLQLLLDNMISELIGQTTAPINPVNHKTIIRRFSSEILELDYYPVKCISSIQVGSTILSGEDYVLDQDLGIIYFNSRFEGMLVVEYVCQLSDDEINNSINPLIFDMFKYRLTNNFTDNGAMTSVKEGDVQVNYDTSTSLGNLIYSRINNLKSKYSIRIKVL